MMLKLRYKCLSLTLKFCIKKAATDHSLEQLFLMLSHFSNFDSEAKYYIN
jgi:hypothetical protein